MSETGFDETPEITAGAARGVRRGRASSTSPAAAAAPRPSTSRQIADERVGRYRRARRNSANSRRPHGAPLALNMRDEDGGEGPGVSRAASCPASSRADRHRLALRQHRRAHQRHRLEGVRAADPRRPDFEDALGVARQQVENGAQIIDINMDEAMLDSKAAMVRFLNLIAGEPEIARVPIMIDSSKWEVIEAGLQCVQGKGIVNSISMKEGEAEFRASRPSCAPLRRRGGRHGVRREGPGRHLRAQDRDLRSAPTRSCRSASRLPAEDIIFDPNIFAIATGIEEHDNYAVDFIDATRWIKQPTCRAPRSRAASRT